MEQKKRMRAKDTKECIMYVYMAFSNSFPYIFTLIIPSPAGTGLIQYKTRYVLPRGLQDGSVQDTIVDQALLRVKVAVIAGPHHRVCRQTRERYNQTLGMVGERLSGKENKKMNCRSCHNGSLGEK